MAPLRPAAERRKLARPQFSCSMLLSTIVERGGATNEQETIVMGAFVLVRRCASKQSNFRLTKIKSTMTDQGFSNPRHLRLDEYDLFLYEKQVSGTKNCVEFENGDFCASTGSLIYQGKLGAPALTEFYSGFEPSSDLHGNSIGSYCVVIRKFGKTYLFIDPLGIYKVYCDEDDTIWSSSFLAILSALDKRTIDVQSVYEYVFTGATYGNDTVIEEIKLVDCGSLVEIGDGVKKSPISKNITTRKSGIRDASSAEYHLGILRSIYTDIVSCFDDKIDTALSGGYDSRLTLALLLEKNIKPQVHVYGKSSDPDVQVARTIDNDLGLALVHTDKSRMPLPSKREFAKVVKSNFLAFDGYPTDGIFGSSADLLTRKERCSSGCLMLNGGGGEIYRNFFYLPEESYTTKQFLHSFYAQFDPKVCTLLFSESGYFDSLAGKVQNVCGTSRDILERFEVELLFPIFRCRFWMGRNNALNNRFGYALTPFIEYKSVEAASYIPIREKNFGRIQGKMINKVNPVLASYISSYGHNFSNEPPLRRKITDSLTLFRPSWLRRRVYRVKNLLGRNERPILLSDPYLEPIIGKEFSYMSDFFHVSGVQDPVQLNRICTLEFLFHEYAPARP